MNFDKHLGIKFSTGMNYIVRVGCILHIVHVFLVIHFSLQKTVDTLVFHGSAPLILSRKRSLALTLVLLLYTLGRQGSQIYGQLLSLQGQQQLFH